MATDSYLWLSYRLDKFESRKKANEVREKVFYYYYYFFALLHSATITTNVLIIIKHSYIKKYQRFYRYRLYQMMATKYGREDGDKGDKDQYIPKTNIQTSN